MNFFIVDIAYLHDDEEIVFDTFTEAQQCINELLQNYKSNMSAPLTIALSTLKDNHKACIWMIIGRKQLWPIQN